MSWCGAGLIYSSELRQLWGGEQASRQPTGALTGAVAQPPTPPPAAVTVIEVGEQR